VRLTDICETIADCPHTTAKDEGVGFPLVRTANIGEGKLIYEGMHRVSKEVYDKRNSRAVPKCGDLIFAREAPAGNIAVIQEGELVCLGQRTVLISPIREIADSDFIALYILSPVIQTLLVKKSIGATVAHVNLKEIRPFLIPLPPLDEQKRIVAKIEKLMPLVEEYGKMEETRLQLDADLPSALEKSILQEAIQGKLVPQDPNDEPASELLKRIAVERKTLIKAGKLKRDKSESVIFRGSDRLAYETRNGDTVCIQDEIPFEIPDSWEWVRLGSVCSIVRGSGIKRSETTDSGSPCIRYGEIYTTYGYSFQTARSCTSESVAAKCHKAHSGDVLCTLTGECKEEIAKATAYLGTEAIAIGGDLARISDHPYNPMLLVYFMFSPFMLSQKADKSNGDIIVHIGKEAIEDLLIPLPPRAEQKRIVAKVANLLLAIKSFTT
jgi:type I restriction enzyme S subunit